MQESEWGGYKWKASPHHKTGEKSKQNILNGNGALGPGKRRCQATARCARQSEGRTHSKWDKNNLYLQPQRSREGRIRPSDGFKVYDATNTKYGSRVGR